MKKLSLEEFAVVMYTEYIHEVLSSLLRSEDIGLNFYKRDLKDQKEIESLLKKYASEIASGYVKELKTNGLLKEKLSEKEEKKVKEILDTRIKEFVENVKKQEKI